jgi:hypothetical protein
VLDNYKGLVIWALQAGRYRTVDVIYDRTAEQFRETIATLPAA